MKYVKPVLLFVSLILIVLAMNLDNPTNQRLPKFLSELKKDVEGISTVRQSQFGNWIDIADAVTTNTYDEGILEFENDGINPRGFFTKGDKIRWKQSGDSNYKYGYVIDVTDTTFTVTGGSTYSFNDGDLLELGKGISENPTGFPVVLAFNSTLHAYDQSHSVSNQGTFTGKFFIINGMVTAFYKRTGFQLTGVTDFYVHEDLPIARDSNFEVRIAGIGSNSTDLPYAIAISSPAGAGSADPVKNCEVSRLPYAVYRLSTSSAHYFTIMYKI